MSQDSSTPLFERRGFVYMALAAGLSVLSYLAYKAVKANRLKVIPVDASVLDKADEQLIDDMF